MSKSQLARCFRFPPHFETSSPHFTQRKDLFGPLWLVWFARDHPLLLKAAWFDGLGGEKRSFKEENLQVPQKPEAHHMPCRLLFLGFVLSEDVGWQNIMRCNLLDLASTPQHWCANFGHDGQTLASDASSIDQIWGFSQAQRYVCIKCFTPMSRLDFYSSCVFINPHHPHLFDRYLSSRPSSS